MPSYSNHFYFNGTETMILVVYETNDFLVVIILVDMVGASSKQNDFCFETC